jgi:hypothetical protein
MPQPAAIRFTVCRATPGTVGIGRALAKSARAPLVAFTVLFVLIDLALLFIYMGTAQSSASLSKVSGYFVFSFVVVGA